MPWKVDKNKSGLYFDSHQVVLTCMAESSPHGRGICQSTGFNEFYSQHSPEALRNADRKMRGSEHFGFTHTQKRCSHLHKTDAQVAITWTATAAQTVSRVQFHVCFHQCLYQFQLFGQLFIKSSFPANNRRLCWCLWGHMREGWNNEPVSIQLCPSHSPIASSVMVAFSERHHLATGPQSQVLKKQ